MSYFELSKEQKLYRKVLELDADEGATNMLLISELRKVIGRHPKPAGFKNLYKSEKRILEQLTMVSSIIFRILGDQQIDADTFDEESYPRPRLRNAISMLTITENIFYQKIDQYVKFQKSNIGIPLCSLKGLQNMVDGFETITGNIEDRESINDAWSETGISQINKLRNEWNVNLKDKLQPYSYQLLSNKKKVKYA